MVRSRYTILMGHFHDSFTNSMVSGWPGTGSCMPPIDSATGSQVFRTDGTFVNEVVIPTDTVPIQTQGTGVAGSTWRTGFSADPEQRFLYIADMANSKVWILNRGDLQILGSFDSPRAHHMAGADSKGNLYTTGGRSPQKFLLKGGPAASTTGR